VSEKSPPRELTEPSQREMARRMRDSHWAFMEKVQQLGTLWWCTWDKERRHKPPADDVYVSGLIDAMELSEWISRHEDWWVKGEWSDERYALPVQLTDEGRRALAERHLYDMEPVTGGMVEPGWICVPAELLT